MESNNPFEPHAQYTRGANAHQGTRRTSPLLILAVVLSSIALVVSIAALFISFISLGSTTTSADSANTTDTVIEESDSAVDGDTTDTLETEEAASSESEWEGDSGNWHIEISTEFQTDSFGEYSIIVVSAEATNIGSENNSTTDITFTAWQNGIELDNGFNISAFSSLYELYSEDLSDTHLGKTIQPGTTLTLTYCFELEDSEGSFELEVYDSSSADQIVTATFEL